MRTFASALLISAIAVSFAHAEPAPLLGGSRVETGAQAASSPAQSQIIGAGVGAPADKGAASLLPADTAKPASPAAKTRTYGPDLAGIVSKPLSPIIDAINHGIAPIDTAIAPASTVVKPLTDPITPAPEFDPTAIFSPATTTEPK